MPCATDLLRRSPPPRINALSPHLPIFYGYVGIVEGTTEALSERCGERFAEGLAEGRSREGS